MKTRLSQILALAPATLVALTPLRAQAAAIDYFLKIEGIEGESQDSKHGKEIVLQSFSFGVSNLGTGAPGGGGAAGKASFSDFALTTTLSRPSPTLYQACASGKNIKSALLTLRRAGKTQQEFYTVKLEDVRVTSVKTSGAAASDTVPAESFTLNFSKVTWDYKPQKADGSLDSPISTTWDIKANKGT